MRIKGLTKEKTIFNFFSKKHKKGANVSNDFILFFNIIVLLLEVRLFFDSLLVKIHVKSNHLKRIKKLLIL